MLQSNNKRNFNPVIKHPLLFWLDNQFQKEYSGYLTLFLNGCIRKKMSIFFYIKLFHHLLKTYFGSEFGKVLFYLLLYYHRLLAFSFLKRKKIFLPFYQKAFVYCQFFCLGKSKDLLWLVLQKKCGFDKLVPMILTYV